MKRLLVTVMLPGLLLAIAHAETIPPHGYGQIGLQAVVLCEQLSLRRGPSASSNKVRTLQHGDLPIVIEQSNGWACGPRHNSSWMEQ